MKILKNCSVHSLTFGGHCLECGKNAPKIQKKSIKERKEYLRALGFEI